MKPTQISIGSSTIPITLYDFFSHLISGTVFCIYMLFLMKFFKIDLPLELLELFEQYNFFGFEAIFLIIVAYLVGYIISGFSLWFLQKRVVTRFLSTPMRNLFRSKRPKKEFAGEYKHPYQKAIQEEIKNQYEDITGNKFNIPASFTFALHFVKDNCPESYSRVQIFQIHSTFSRNLSLSFGVFSIMELIAWMIDKKSMHLFAFFIFLFSSCIFFRRYLQFSRLYANEVFMGFYTKIKTNKYLLKIHDNAL